jgi:[ribosomal protein S5]-alanine N-acetyltransferase
MAVPLPPDVLELERLRLRRPRADDAPALFEIGSDADVARYAVWPRPTEFDAVVERLAGRHASWESGAEFYWVLTLLPEDRAIGAISCAVQGPAAEFGFLLALRYWGNGYATEAARAVVAWLWSVPSIARVWATCDVDNIASARVLAKAGLSLESTLRRAIVRPNLSAEPRDAFVYSKVR